MRLVYYPNPGIENTMLAQVFDTSSKSKKCHNTQKPIPADSMFPWIKNRYLRSH